MRAHCRRAVEGHRASHGAANCNASPWNAGAWVWNPARVTALLFAVGVVAEACSGRSYEGLRFLAWVLSCHGPAPAWRLLHELAPRSVGGLGAEELARVALLGVGALDLRAARAGRVVVVERDRVLGESVRVLRGAGCGGPVIVRELEALVSVWSPSSASADVARAMRRGVRA